MPDDLNPPPESGSGPPPAEDTSWMSPEVPGFEYVPEVDDDGAEPPAVTPAPEPAAPPVVADVTPEPVEEPLPPLSFNDALPQNLFTEEEEQQIEWALENGSAAQKRWARRYEQDRIQQHHARAAAVATRAIAQIPADVVSLYGPVIDHYVNALPVEQRADPSVPTMAVSYAFSQRALQIGQAAAIRELHQRYNGAGAAPAATPPAPRPPAPPVPAQNVTPAGNGGAPPAPAPGRDSRMESAVRKLMEDGLDEYAARQAYRASLVNF